MVVTKERFKNKTDFRVKDKRGCEDCQEFVTNR